MPSIAGFIQSLLSEDMYATGMLEKMDARISQLNAGQLRLLLNFVEKKVPGLTNKTIIDAYTKLLRKATAERESRYEEEMRGERERLIQLKAAHAGVNAKAWDTSHANLDKELAKFQKFLKSKARRVAEEEVLQEEMEKLHTQLLGLPARRVAADTRKHVWWAIGAFFFFVLGPILVLCIVPFGLHITLGAFLFVAVLALVCWFVGVLRGIVVVPVLDDDEIEAKTRRRAKETLKGYRADVQRTYEATEQKFAADMKWRDDWVKGRKEERRNKRRKAKNVPKMEDEGLLRGQGGNGGRIFPEEEGGGSSRAERAGWTTEDGVGGRVQLEAASAISTGPTNPATGGAHTPAADIPDAKLYQNVEAEKEKAGGAEDGSSTEPPRGESGAQAAGNDPEDPSRGNSLTDSRKTSRRNSPPGGGSKVLSSEEDQAGTERDAGGDRTRGPCQGSCLFEVAKKELEEQGVPSLSGIASPPSVSNLGLAQQGVPSSVLTTAVAVQEVGGGQQAAVCGRDGNGDMAVVDESQERTRGGE